MAFPATVVEIAFGSTFKTAAVDRVWTDVSDYVDGTISINRGRTDPLSKCEPSTLGLTLDNTDGRFTAGKTTGAYYPNVRLGVPIRVTTTPSGGVASVRFLGYVDEWPTEWPDGTTSYATATISATSRLGRLGLSTVLDSTTIAEILADSPAALYEFEESDAATVAVDTSGNLAPPLTVAGVGEPVAFGGQDEDGVPLGATFNAGKFLKATLATMSEWTIAVPFATSSAASMTIAGFLTGGGFTISAGTVSCGGLTVGTGLADGERHVVTASRDASSNLTVYLDGDLVTTGTSSASVSMLTVGASLLGTSLFVGSVGKVAVFASELTAARVGAHADAYLSGFSGEATSARLHRYAGYAGIAGAEVSAATAGATMGLVDTTGLSVVDAFRVVEDTEGGILFDARDGTLTMHARNHRYHSLPALTLSMTDQEVEAGYSPRLNRGMLRNDITATDSGLNVGQAVTARVVNQASVDEYGQAGGSVSVASDNANEAHAAASWLVALYGEPSPRVPDLGVNLLPFGLVDQAAILAADVGTRIQVTAQPDQAAEASSDFFVEGYAEEIGSTTYMFGFHVSPAYESFNKVAILDHATFGLLDNDNRLGY